MASQVRISQLPEGLATLQTRDGFEPDGLVPINCLCGGCSLWHGLFKSQAKQGAVYRMQGLTEVVGVQFALANHGVH